MNEIKKLIENFCESFDKKDWNLMSNCLNEELEVDYESFRNTPRQKISAKEYIEQRKTGLKNLRTTHKTKDYKISRIEDGIACQCKFEIRRYEVNSEQYLHSFGEYEFVILQKQDDLKIIRIKQIVKRTEGDKSIHGAFKK